jgi:hypothetical protein
MFRICSRKHKDKWIMRAIRAVDKWVQINKRYHSLSPRHLVLLNRCDQLALQTVLHLARDQCHQLLEVCRKFITIKNWLKIKNLLGSWKKSLRYNIVDQNRWNFEKFWKLSIIQEKNIYITKKLNQVNFQKFHYISYFCYLLVYLKKIQQRF